MTGITLNARIDQVNDSLKNLLIDHKNSTKKSLGSLNLRIFDPAINRSVNLRSGTLIPVNRDLVRMLEKLDIDFTVEKAR